MSFDRAAAEETLAAARRQLLAARNAAGHWVGELSGSALSTATAVGALALMGRAGGGTETAFPVVWEMRSQSPLASQVRAGLQWLVDHQNPDGGWGDTVLSESNISTTLLVWSAFALAGVADAPPPQAHVSIGPAGRRGSDAPPEISAALTAAEGWLARAAGGLDPGSLVRAVDRRYGQDRTFSVPILSMAALAGRLGSKENGDCPYFAWRHVTPLPFELAVLPHRLWTLIGLPVVSYALPALIALGQLRFHFLPPRNPIVRLARRLARRPSLRVLERIQPSAGGFLEAAPLTAFVTMALAAVGLHDHPVARQGAAFLRDSARPDGSWPIDTNLATWLTTLAVDALGGNCQLPIANCPLNGDEGPMECGDAVAALPAVDVRTPAKAATASPHSILDAQSRKRILDWLLAQQYRVEHPYTHARPGGWAWTDLPGGVPDADDTAGALLALATLDDGQAPTIDSATAGVRWLLDLQNADGGMPTFCRGWRKLPFDRSAPDLTAHAVAAWAAWRDRLDGGLAARTSCGIARAVAYLRRAQRDDGSWAPLWFGNQHAPDCANLTYGTARVAAMLARANCQLPIVNCQLPIEYTHRACRRSIGNRQLEIGNLLARAAAWLVAAANPDGGWGGAPGVPSSIEETALAVGALACGTAFLPARRDAGADRAVAAGVAWLVEHTDRGRRWPVAPIGFYFAQLWYFERLYPLIFTVWALARALGRPDDRT